MFGTKAPFKSNEELLMFFGICCVNATNKFFQGPLKSQLLIKGFIQQANREKMLLHGWVEKINCYTYLWARLGLTLRRSLMFTTRRVCLLLTISLTS